MRSPVLVATTGSAQGGVITGTAVNDFDIICYTEQTRRRRSGVPAHDATARTRVEQSTESAVALNAVTIGPAFVRNGRMDLLAANQLARAFYLDVYDDPRRPSNIARFTFLDPAGRQFHPAWDPPPKSVSPSCGLKRS